jgi:hypothetical protein
MPFVIFSAILVYVLAVGDFWWQFWYFLPFWSAVPKKIWQPCLRNV